MTSVWSWAVGGWGVSMEASDIRARRRFLSSASRTSLKILHNVLSITYQCGDIAFCPSFNIITHGFSVFLYFCPPSTVFWLIAVKMVSWRLKFPNLSSFLRSTTDRSGFWLPAYKCTLSITHTLVLCSSYDMHWIYLKHSHWNTWIHRSVSAV